MLYLSKKFRQYVRVTSSFFLLRFLCAIVVSLFYIIVAAFIQDLFVKLLGESSFNYIVGGLLSLFLGVLFCHYVGSILFMFLKGWHVAALAYAPKIIRSHAPAFAVGIRAFNKNLISFGAVYGVRLLLNSVIRKFRHKLWELSDDIPYGDILKRFSNNPIVEYISSDVLHYAFDAGVFYLVRHPPEDVNEVPNTILTAVKKYLYAIPSILLSSVQSYILFRFLPKLAKWLLFIWTIFTQGLVAGVLLIVIMFPLFYILDNAFFDPLTMVMFLSAYAKVCEKEQNPEDPIVKAVNSIIDSDGEEPEEVATTLDGDEEEAPPKSESRSKKQRSAQAEEPVDLPPDEELFGSAQDDTRISQPAGVSPSALAGLAGMASGTRTEFRQAAPSSEEVLIETPPEDEAITEPVIDFTEQTEVEKIEEPPVEEVFRAGGGLSALFGGLGYGDLDEDPLQGTYGEDTIDRAQNMLLGDDEE